MFKRLKRILKTVLVLVVAASLYVGWVQMTDREFPGPIQAFVDSQRQVTGSDPGFRDLRVAEDEFGLFGGTITVENTSMSLQTVLLTIELFRGDQNVGTLTATVAVKPNSASSAELVSGDPYATWTDAHVDLMR